MIADIKSMFEQMNVQKNNIMVTINDKKLKGSKIADESDQANSTTTYSNSAIDKEI